jgi:hypothetical protein
VKHRIFLKNPPVGGLPRGRAGGKSALMNNLEKISNHPEAISGIGTNLRNGESALGLRRKNWIHCHMVLKTF